MDLPVPALESVELATVRTLFHGWQTKCPAIVWAPQLRGQSMVVVAVVTLVSWWVPRIATESPCVDFGSGLCTCIPQAARLFGKSNY